MIVQMPDLNDERFGRFGNQIFKFLFLKLIERNLGYEIRYPNWLGCLAFSIPESLPLLPCNKTLDLSILNNLSLSDCLHEIENNYSSNNCILNISGFFQFHSLDFLEYKNFIIENFSLNKLLLNQINNKINSTFKSCQIISIHLRRGDYLNYKDNNIFWPTPIKSIFCSIEDIKATDFKNNLIYLASDDLPYASEVFRENKIDHFTAHDLFIFEDNSLLLLVDFFIFCTSNINIISNSSLSFFASMLNLKSKIFLRPIPNLDHLVAFDPWNSSVLISK